jgi:hypothetical protein
MDVNALIQATMAKRQASGLKITITKGTHPDSGLDVSGHTRYPSNAKEMAEICSSWRRKGYEFSTS